MKILVTVKRVTDYERKVKIAPDGRSLLTDGMSFVANPFDEIAVEEALRLCKAHGGEVVVVSVGSRDSTQEIRKALAMGAQRGILVIADNPDSDIYAQALKKIVEKEQPELVILGKQNTDDDANQEGQLLAGYLNWPQATFASKEEGLDSAEEKAQKPGLHMEENGQLTVIREADGGLEYLSIDLPAVVTTDLRLNQPRFASLPGIMKAKKKKIEELSLTDIGVEATPKLSYTAYSEPKERQAGQMVENVDVLVDKLRNEAKVI